MSVTGLPFSGNVTPAEADSLRAAIAIPAHVVQAKGHGHGGTAMALAPLAHVLYQRILRHNPSNPVVALGAQCFVQTCDHFGFSCLWFESWTGAPRKNQLLSPPRKYSQHVRKLRIPQTGVNSLNSHPSVRGVSAPNSLLHPIGG